MALFPVSPTNGQQTTVNNITYTYDSTQTAWVRTSTSGDINAGNGTFSGNLAVGANLTVGSNLTVNGNIIGNFANGNSNINIPIANGNINFSSKGNANVVVITGTGANITGTLDTGTGNIIAGNVNAGNLLTANYTNAVLTTNAQPNITSLGTLTSLAVTGNISANYYTGNGVLLSGVYTPSVTKTANYAAVAGDVLACNTITTGSFTVTLPASPVAGQRGILIYDAGTTETSNGFAANNLTVARNGSTIHNIADDVLFTTKGVSVTFEYVDGTWRMRVG